MTTRRRLCVLCLFSATSAFAQDFVYVKQGTREETEKASLAATAAKLVTIGPWKSIGPFDNTDGRGVGLAYPPEQEIDFAAEYLGAGRKPVRWTDGPAVPDGQVIDLNGFGRSDASIAYLVREVTAERDLAATLFVGSDDTVTAWVNGTKVHAWTRPRGHPVKPDAVPVRLRKGVNSLLFKVGNFDGPWQFSFRLWPDEVVVTPDLAARINADFPNHEAAYWKIDPVPPPDGAVFEVGGLAHLPDGALAACTRRGGIWILRGSSWSLFADGLHEPLGILVGEAAGTPACRGLELFVVQRPELTRIRDADGDGVAETYDTVCNRWGTSGNYHEYSYGPVRDREGNYWICLNLGHSNNVLGEMDSLAPYRGWVCRITPAGELVPWASGLRSPNGIGLSPDGDLFVAENQGGWVGTSELFHIEKGAFYGHPSSLKWDPSSPGHAAVTAAAAASGTVPGPETFDAFRKRPALLLEYGPMGRSPSQPVWDVTDGKFGPFAGQLFLGDQTQGILVRCAPEKVGGEMQGASFPFLGGFPSGVNRLAFAPDGSLAVGQTDRGWASVGGQSFALHRVTWTGKVPMEIRTIALEKDGFTFEFTKPLDPATARDPAAWSVEHYRYLYRLAYGSPQVDTATTPVREVRVSADGRRATILLPALVPGRLYEFHLGGIRSADGEEILHPTGYYTLNRLR